MCSKQYRMEISVNLISLVKQNQTSVLFYLILMNASNLSHPRAQSPLSDHFNVFFFSLSGILDKSWGGLVMGLLFILWSSHSGLSAFLQSWTLIYSFCSSPVSLHGNRLPKQTAMKVNHNRIGEISAWCAKDQIPHPKVCILLSFTEMTIQRNNK